MKKITSAEDESKSADIAGEKLEGLRALLPEAFTEGKIDFDVLRQLLGEAVDDKPEKYGLNWHGKRSARQLALTPSAGTLRPGVGESNGWETTRNLVIEGDNLEVLKLLQKSYAGRVKLIYIDPPYNTGGDFVYPDDYSDGIARYLETTGQWAEDGAVTSNPETSGRFHTNWLNMMYPRLAVARQLLADDGVLFASIDDAELDNLLALLKELFGPESFVGTFIWEKRKSRENRKVFSVNHDYVVCVARNLPRFVQVRGLLPLTEQAAARYSNPDSDPRGDWQSVAITAQAGHGTKSQFYTIVTPSGRRIDPPSGNCWRFTKERLAELIEDGRIWFGVEGSNVPRQKVFLSEGRQGLTPHTLWTADEVGTTDRAKRALNELFDGRSVFSTPKPVELLQRIVQVGGDSDGIVLDFFAGSGTTGEAVMRANAVDGGSRRFILVQLPEPLSEGVPEQREGARVCTELGLEPNIASLSRERLRRVEGRLRSGGLAESDFGFRSFRLDSSNIAAWDPDRDDLDGSLLDSLEHIKQGRSETDILFELVLKLGLELTVPIETRDVSGVEVHSVGAGTLIACLTDKIGDGEVEDVALGIADWHRELGPVGVTTVVFRDDAFASDVAKTNMTAILEQRGLATVRSL